MVLNIKLLLFLLPQIPFLSPSSVEKNPDIYGSQSLYNFVSCFEKGHFSLVAVFNE